MEINNQRHYAKILWSLKRSRVRTEILKFLANIHPDAGYQAEIAREIGSTPSNARCALSGALWGEKRFHSAYSLISLGLVEAKEMNGKKYYKITDMGLEAARRLGYL